MYSKRSLMLAAYVCLTQLEHGQTP